jgi:hypothetical protein
VEKRIDHPFYFDIRFGDFAQSLGFWRYSGWGSLG